MLILVTNFYDDNDKLKTQHSAFLPFLLCVTTFFRFSVFTIKNINAA